MACASGSTGSFERYRAHKANFTVAIAVQLDRLNFYGAVRDRPSAPQIVEPIAALTHELLTEWTARYPEANAAMREAPSEDT